MVHLTNRRTNRDLLVFAKPHIKCWIFDGWIIDEWTCTEKPCVDK